MLKRSDVFAVLVAAFVLGAGAYLSTYSTDVIRGVGIVLMAAALWGLIVWFLWERKLKSMPIILLFGSIAFAILAAGSLAAWYFLPTPKPPDISAEFESMYANDFTDLLNSESNLAFHIANPANGLDTTINIRFRIHYDFRANIDFLSLYIPTINDARLSAEAVIHLLRDQIPKHRDDLKKVEVGASSPGVATTYGKDMNFSGRVFIYTLNSLDALQTGNLIAYYREAGMFLEIRGNDYYWFHRKH